jgi:hypothetical protein
MSIARFIVAETTCMTNSIDGLYGNTSVDRIFSGCFQEV